MDNQRFIYILLIFVFFSPSFTNIDSKRISKGFTSCYTKEDYAFALSEEILDQVISYSIDKDYEAIQKLMDLQLVFLMKKDVKVYIVDTHIFKGKVEFRLPGETMVLWTVTDALNCN